MIRKFSLLALLFSLTLSFARADEVSKRAKLEQLFVAMKMDSMMNDMLTASMAQGDLLSKTIFGDKPIPPGDQKLLESYQAKMTTLMHNTLSWDKLKPAYVDLYASEYTEADVDGILAFYQSPAGTTVHHQRADESDRCRSQR